ncbi:Piwi domain-containing protein [Mycena leptocephala]|nr:Piwi domain-containing protein [Mycena leptocephala]
MTVANYYQEATGRPLQYPTLLCVEVGQGALIPLELCTVLAGQLVKKEIPDEKKSDLVAFATMKPKDRLVSIRKGLEVLAYGQSEYVRKFGLTVNKEAVSTQARVLTAPTLKYGAGSKAATVQPRNGSWNMCGGQEVLRPCTITAWVLVYFDMRLERGLQDIITSFVAGCESTGMKVTHPDPIVRGINGQGNIPEQLRAAGAACFEQKKVGPTLFVVILPEGGNDIYTMVKNWGDIKRGIATQCMKTRNCTRANIQFWANVALKWDQRQVGGINVITDPTQVTLLSDPHNPTVVMGRMSCIPAGTNGRPSYSAVVSSKVQASRQELISDLQMMTKYLLTKYMSYREAVEKVPLSKKAPKRLIFYRDGVSEGQFQQVLDHELPLIKAACQELGIALVLHLCYFVACGLVSGYLNHTRLFPADKDADKSGNCPAGTVVDRDIGHPTEFDFYLQSHGGILGTSRPGHYSVENNLTADTMQALSFALCHVYAGSTRSVSIPAPYTMRQGLRAREDSLRSGEGYRSLFGHGTSDNSESLEAYKNDFMPLHANQMGRMYFSVSVQLTWKRRRPLT